ncbi:MAG: hypothetical protein AB1390_10970 [Nitrospirota bacterium]
MIIHFLNSFIDIFRLKTLPFLSYVIFGILFSLCILAKTADAHKVNIFAYADDGTVHAEGYFADGSKCRDCLVKVLDNKTGVVLLEGNTDDNGQFSFNIPRTTALKLILHAGMGHQNEYVLTEEEIRMAMPGEAKKQTQQDGLNKKSISELKLSKKESDRVHNTKSLKATTRDLEETIEKVVDKKLQPIMKILIKLQEKSEKPGLTDIIGGIGYIIGIMGIIAYFKGRAANKRSMKQ